VKPILLDTSVIVALLDRKERLHARCETITARLSSPFVTCEAVIAESCHLLRRLPGAAEAVIDNVVTGNFQIPMQLSEGAREIRRIMSKYRDRRIDLADACLVHLATELRTPDILTLDRDFNIYRWGRNNAFHLLIPLR
jgi:predicted nucleic acid-binding protein